MPAKAAKIALSSQTIFLGGREPASVRAARIDLRGSEADVRSRIAHEIDDACRATDAALVWDALSAVRISEQQLAVLAGLAKVNAMKLERAQRSPMRKRRRKKAVAGRLAAVPTLSTKAD